MRTKTLREICLAPDRATAETAIAAFAEKYAPKYDKAVECLIKNRETVLTFYAFPDEVRRIIYTTDEIDKRFVFSHVLYFSGAGDLVAKNGASAGISVRPPDHSRLAVLRTASGRLGCH